MSRKTAGDYSYAITLFESIPGWRNADELIDACRNKIKEINENEEALRKEAERAVKRKKRTYALVACMVLAIAALVTIWATIVTPSIKKSNFIAKYGQDAYDKLYALEIGDSYFFGTYEQDNDLRNGSEDIEWIVINKEGGKVLLISKYALEYEQYNTYAGEVTWDASSLRKWLNDDFLNTAFSDEEKAIIPTFTVKADKNSKYSTASGKSTRDQVFLLSTAEAEEYLSSMSCEATDYAIANCSDSIASAKLCRWWLRSPGWTNDRAAYCSSFTDGIDFYGRDVTDSVLAVRPVIWIDIGC